MPRGEPKMREYQPLSKKEGIFKNSFLLETLVPNLKKFKKITLVLPEIRGASLSWFDIELGIWASFLGKVT